MPVLKHDTIDFKLTKLHKNQTPIDLSTALHKRVCCGRRFGKSKYAGSCVVRRALSYQEPIWWAAPTFRNAIAAWKEMNQLVQPLVQHNLVRIWKDEMLIEFQSPSSKSNLSAGFVRVVSTQDPNNLRGEGLAGLVYDEAAYGSEYAFYDVISPMLADFENAWTLLITTPNGYNWYYREHQMGVNGVEGYESFHYTSYDNPHINHKVLDNLRHTMTEKAFRQEILAEFVADALSVFPNVQGCIYHNPETEPLPSHNYVMGIDWGSKHDFTAVSVMNADERREVELLRFNKVGFDYQLDRIRSLYDKWRPNAVLAEENAMGMSIVQRMGETGLAVQPFKTSMQSKSMLVRKFALATETQAVGLLDHKEATDELLAYAETVTENGNRKYGAPKGGHDDTVIARMLAWHALDNQLGHILDLDW